MEPIAPGSAAPAIESLDLTEPRLLFFYKVTCPVCQMAAPIAERMQQAYPGRISGIGQDDEGELRSFAEAYGVSFESVQDAPPYAASNAYGVRVVPTLFLVDGSSVLDVAESWDRDGFNRLSHGLSELIGADASTVSTPDDGLPPFRPG